ncbi:helix-turn-helix domain-containing protein [Streptomyces boninensis]|uniref:PucR family transcriptional regulator n=1 Tax=Streptomyces boninensis TaxID=2039455 RepID=UPI003B2131B0
MAGAAPLAAWRDVPPSRIRQFAQLARDEAPALAESILGEVCRTHPALPAALGEAGLKRARNAIHRAVEQFVDQVTSSHQAPSADEREPPPEFKDFGRAAGLAGRSLDSLQAMYRQGVRLAWRRHAEQGQKVGIPPPAMYALAEAGYAYLDGLVDETVRGYAEAAAQQAEERLRLQRRLMDLLLAEDSPLDVKALGDRSSRVGWALPRQVSVAVLRRPGQAVVSPAVAPDVLLDMDSEQPRLVVPDPGAPGRTEGLRRALVGWSGALGPPVPLAAAPMSLRWATTAVALMARGLLPDGEVLHCTEHTEALLLLPHPELLDDLAQRRLAPLESCGPVHARRLSQTLLAWLESRGGSAPDIAAHLGVHPQTVRYRLRQIRELWGESIDDPARRFELELVLRARRLRGELAGR